MNKVLDISQELVDYDNKPLPDTDNTNWTLKKVILTYIRSAHAMSLSDTESGYAYESGFIIGAQTGKIELTQQQYDTIKKLADNARVTSNGQTSPLFPLLISQQAKKLIDAAETLKE